jgi:outer membrane protein OmpA-like peptidoglycan-associated protein
LSQRSVSEPNLVIVGFGEHDPKAKSGDKSSNRRVEIVIGEAGS